MFQQEKTRFLPARALSLPLLLLATLTAPQAQEQAPSQSSQQSFYERGEGIVNIGVIAIRNKENAMKRWRETAKFLSDHIAGREFRIVPSTWEEMDRHIQQRHIEFILTNPAGYVVLEVDHGGQPLATLMDAKAGNYLKYFGSVILRRSDRDDIRTLHDLKGKRFAAVNKSAWGGWYLAFNRLLEHDVVPEDDFAELTFVHSHDKVVMSVRDGAADAGTVRTGILERMSEEGKINLDDFTLLTPAQHDDFPYLVSTGLYPDWPFASLTHVPEALKREVLEVLLRIPPGSDAARTGRYYGWTVPGNYQPVHNVLQRLQVPPYTGFGEIRLEDVAAQYWKELLLIVFFIILLSFAAFYFQRLNRRLLDTQASLETASQEVRLRNSELEKTLQDLKVAQDQIVASEKLASLGTVAAGIAHEIKNPLNLIKNFAELTNDLCTELTETMAPLKKSLDEKTLGNVEDILTDMSGNNEKICHHSRRADSIVHNMLAHSRGGSHDFENSEINKLVEEAMNLSYHSMRSVDTEFNARTESEFDDSITSMYIVPQDLQRVVLNLMNNAFQATHELKQKDADYAPEVRVATQAKDGGVEIRVRDNGPGIPKENVEKLFTPFFTTKPTGSGTGLGLSISYDIVTKMHNGRLTVDSKPGEYTEFCVFIPGDLEAKAREQQLAAARGG
ncbi:MAG: PhnD/SsuA/transferrin family substrate-binding protein [Gammaproteobacteria bacterium]|nr:PhnD/SsuA/transferrin family substrate-binding protein [Gammaproteobacteria bacterium]